MAGGLKEVQAGTAQLPEFQRGWVWPDRGIISLLASISLGYPVGTVMMLRTGGDVRFKERPVEGAAPAPVVRPDRLILDGQQRLTSLFQALKLGAPVKTQDVRRKPVIGWFYIDMVKALDPNADREEAFAFVPSDRKVRNFRNEVIEDYSSPALEYAKHYFPLARLFDPDEWAMGYQEHWDFDRDQIRLWHAFHREVIKRFEQYQVPVIELGKETPRQAVCQVFEKVNTGGVTLTVFELLTATFAAEEFDLRRDWDERETEWKSRPDLRVLREVSNTDFLQAVTLLATQERRQRALAGGTDDERAPRIGCRRVDMLGLQRAEYEKWAPEVVSGLKRAARLLHGEHIFHTRFLPYGTQLIPLASILATLGHDADNVSARERITRWFWCGVFGELYGGTTETRFSRDLPDVVGWVRGGTEPRTVTEAQFDPGRLLTLRTRGSAAYKGLYALLLKEGSRDWRTGDRSDVDNYFDEAVDIHHIFPKAWCEQRNIAPATYNSIINKTPLTARTNRIIGGQAPSAYLTRLARHVGTDESTIDKQVGTHLIDVGYLRADDFDGFFSTRQQALLDAIAGVMGKPVMTTDSQTPVGDDEEFDDTDDL